MTRSVADLTALLDTHYPPHLAESWDSVGLVAGHPTDPVTRCLVAVDVTMDIVSEARKVGADMILAHHPLLFRGVDTVAANTTKGQILTELIRHRIALFTAHTNADSARPGVNDALIQAVGATSEAALATRGAQQLDSWTVYVPSEELASLQNAIFASGAGEIGEYSRCSFHSEGTGQFLPSENAHPAAGRTQELFSGPEICLEFIASRHLRKAIWDAIKAAHSYEEPAMHVVEHQDPASEFGLGRVGVLPKPLTLAEFAAQVASNLPDCHEGIKFAGDPQREVRTVAVSSGSGFSHHRHAVKAGADVFITSDISHHEADEFVRDTGVALIDVPHWVAEAPWCEQAAALITDQLEIPTHTASTRTDPWSGHVHSS